MIKRGQKVGNASYRDKKKNVKAKASRHTK